MPLNSHLMKGAWALQKNYLLGLVLIASAAGGYYQFSFKPAQETAQSEKERLERLLAPENFDAEALAALVQETTASDEMKLLVLSTIDAAESDPATVTLAISQVKMLLAAKEENN